VSIPDAWLLGYLVEIGGGLALVALAGFAAGWWARGSVR
jgi:3-dehydroquinate synthetase